MPRKPRQVTRYAVHSSNTGALICGPYEAKRDADRECRRLNKEASTGVRADDGEPINYLDVFHCAACGSLPEPAPDEEGRRLGLKWCPTCESYDVELVSVRQVPQRVLHEGEAQGYEVRSRSAEGVEVVLG